MVNEIQNLLVQYFSWLKDKTVFRQIEDRLEITTPFLDRHNDYLQIFVKNDNGGFILSDDGYIIDDLRLSGCKLESKNRQALLKMTLNGFGIHLEKNILQTRASKDNFAVKKHDLIQAMLAINDMFYLAQPVVESLFLEDVTAWLDLHGIRYTPKVRFTGKSSFDYSFDFVIPKSRTHPERLLNTINRPNKEKAQSTIMAWFDTREVRLPNSRAYVFLNDSEQQVSPSILDALNNYDVRPVLWSHKEDVQEELAA